MPGLVSAALEISYPQVPFAPLITGNNSTLDYIKYYYSFLVAIGTIVAVIVLIGAGINLFLSGGEPAKISKAKTQITGAVIGIVVLFSSYLILNSINQEIPKAGISSLQCGSDWDICVEYRRGGELRYEAGLDDNPNLNLGPADEITIRQYKGLKEIWGFPAENFGGTPFRVGGYQNNDINDFKNSLPGSLHIDNNVKSIKVYKKLPGMYLYDAANFGSSGCAPLYIKASVPNLEDSEYYRSETLGNCKYKDRIKSIKILNQPGSKFYAVLFAWSDYNKAYDYTFYPSLTPLPSVSQVIYEDKNSLPSRLNVNSVLLFRSSESFLNNVKDSGITIYNVLNCYVPAEVNTPAVAGCLLPEVDHSHLFESKKIDSVCPEFIGAGQVLSVRVAKQYGILLLSKSIGTELYELGYYFDISDPNVISGNCISNNIFFNKRNEAMLNNVNLYIVVLYEEKL